jgi:hypothetical protein
VTVHSVLPGALTAAVDQVLGSAGVRHVAHEERDAAEAGACAAMDRSALALIGPLRSAAVAEAVEATAPAGLALLAPLATWVGVTRDDEPGCEDAARHDGTVLRMVARDSVVAQRIADRLRAQAKAALVVAGGHPYGRQLDEQLAAAGLARTDDRAEADVVVLAGLEGEAEIGRAAALSPLPVIAFDGVQGAPLGAAREVQMALPIGPRPGADPQDLFTGVESARKAAELVRDAFVQGARDRAAMLAALRESGGWDEYGDPYEPAVWLWRADDRWRLEAHEAI